MNITTSRMITSFVAAGAVCAMTACGAEIAPPAQDIGGNQDGKATETPSGPTKTSRGRMDFGDSNGTAKPQPKPQAEPEPRKAADAGKGSGNRMDFRDLGY